MPVPGLDRCFYCNDPAHWHDKCWTRNPPTSKDHHEARIVMYRDWADPERRKVTLHQKRQLIEHENAMWAKVSPKETRRKAS